MLLFPLFRLAAYAQSDVVVTVAITPPYPRNLADYADNPAKTLIRLQNTSGASLSVQLGGSIVGENGIAMRSSPQFKSPTPIVIGANATVMLNGSELSNLFDIHKITLEGISKQQLVRANGLPEGNYTLCIRAFDYQTSQPLSDEFIGCTPFTVIDLEQPFITSPICADDQTIVSRGPQNVIFNWTTPAGAPPTTEYTLKVVEMLDLRRNPGDAIYSATTPAFFEQTIRGNAFIYGPTHPTLVSGRKYAFQVIARDPMGKVNFRQEGTGNLCSFIYAQTQSIAQQDLGTPPPVNQQLDPKDFNCACKIERPTGTMSNASVKVGTELQVGQFRMKVLNVQVQGNKLSGEGKINLPLVDSKLVPVLVQFTDVQVNPSLQLMSGLVRAKVKDDVTFLPKMPNPDLSTVPLSSNDLNSLDTYFDRNAKQMLSNINTSADNLGFELPLGLDKGVGGIRTVVAITGLTFTPTQAAFDALTVVDLVGEGTKVALGGSGICVNNGGLCGQGTLYLAEDLRIASARLTLKGRSGSLAAPTDSGTYVVFDKTGFSRMRIRANFEFPQNMLERQTNRAQAVSASLVADAVSWSDWLGRVEIDPFYLSGSTDLGFRMKENILAVYDHSSKRNPPNLPNIPEKENLKNTTWEGFYLPEMMVDLPPAIRKIGTGEAVTASAKDLIVDKMGLSGALQINNLFSVGEGDLGGWYYSVDNIHVKFLNNSFVSGGMQGKVVLPISGTDPNKSGTQLSYTCNLSKPQEALQFQFVIKPTDHLEVPMWLAKFKLLNSSNITITAEEGNFLAAADLSGYMDVEVNIPSVPKIEFHLMEFEGLVVKTKPDYLSVRKFHAGTASPQKWVSGFPVTLKDIRPVINGSQAGLGFTLDINLSDIKTIPNAAFGFQLLGDLRFKQGRPDWTYATTLLDKVALKGELGPGRVDGFVEFIRNKGALGDGVQGCVDVTMPPGFNVKGQVMLGKAQQGFYYFYCDALLKLPPPGITIGGGIIPVSIFGFGGGFYYNLAQRPFNVEAFMNEGADGKNCQDISNRFTPQRFQVGMQASVVVGISDGTSFQAKGTLTADANAATMAVGNIRLDVNTYLINPLADIEKAFVKARGVINYDAANKIFDAAYDVPMQYPPAPAFPIVSSRSWFHFKANMGSNQYFVKMGEPSNPNTMSFLKMVNFKSYFMLGNSDIPGMPPPPSEVVSGLGSAYVADRNATAIRSGAGFAHGSSFQLGSAEDLKFLIFFMKLGAAIGYDISLLRYTEGCNGNPDPPGLNGWYAVGQEWMWAQFAFGLDVDEWIFKGKVTVGEVKMAALLRGGLPNPTWFEGMLYGEYNLFNGWVKGRMNFKAAFPHPVEKCVPEANPFASGQPIISEVAPSDGASGISILARPRVSFNYPVDTPFELEGKDSDGGIIYQNYMLEVDRWEIYHGNQLVASKANRNLPLRCTESLTNEGYLLTLIKGFSFEPDQSNYRLEVHVQVKIRLKNGLYDIYKFNKKPVEETKIVHFSTGPCIKSLSEERVAEVSYPFSRQRYLLQNEQRDGYVKLREVPKCLMAGDMRAVFTPLRTNATAPETPIQYIENEKKLAFRIPDLPNETVVRLDIIQRAPKKKSKFDFDQSKLLTFSSRNILLSDTRNQSPIAAVASTFQQGGKMMLVAAGSDLRNKVELRTTSIAGLGEDDNLTDQIIYTYYFRTSRYNTLAEKLNNMAPGGVAQITPSGSLGEVVEADIGTSERFDVFDVKGYSYPDEGQNQAIIRPLVSITEDPSANAWYTSYVTPYYISAYRLKASGHFNHLKENMIRYPEERQEVGDFPPTGPVYLLPWSADPPLSNLELGFQFNNSLNSMKVTGK